MAQLTLTIFEYGKKPSELILIWKTSAWIEAKIVMAKIFNL